MRHQYHDGGRETYFKGNAGDCVTRAIAIATGKDYKEVYDTLRNRQYEWAHSSRSKSALKARKLGRSARQGVFKEVYSSYLADEGYNFVPTMAIGSGCTTHLRAEDLPSGTLIVRLSKHIACVKDGVLYDTYDCSREGTRCVYGYWIID